jgi:hypothetical protein
VAGIFVDVYFGRIVHGKHAVGASGICMMRISVAAPIPAYGLSQISTWWSLSCNLDCEAPLVARKRSRC